MEQCRMKVVAKNTDMTNGIELSVIIENMPEKDIFSDIAIDSICQDIKETLVLAKDKYYDKEPFFLQTIVDFM